MLRRIFGPRRDRAAAGRRKLRNDELHELNPSPAGIRIIVPKRMRLPGLVACMG
jgi:hypothetical protein